MDASKQPGLRIEQVFLSKAHFEHREDAIALPRQTPVNLETTVTLSTALSADKKRGFLAVSVTTDDAAKPIYRINIEMVGLVAIDEKAPNLEVEEYLTRQGPAMMLPFLREALANITSRGRFGPVWLNPLNLHAPDVPTPIATTPDEPTIGGAVE